jgi:hypothetical protein
MHPGDHSGHVIDLGSESTATTQGSSMLMNNDEMIEYDDINTNKIQTVDENGHQFYQQVISIKN